MNRLLVFVLFAFLFGIDSCKKEENSNADQFPEWLQTKITELVSDQNLCKITDVTIIEYKGEKYYHVYCGIWSCMYCQLFDEHGTRPAWNTDEWNGFLANQKVIKTFPACQ